MPPTPGSRGLAPQPGRGLVTVGGLALLAGIVTANSAAIALGATLVALPLIVRHVVRRALAAAVVTRVAERRASEGDQVTITLALENRSSVPLFFPRLRNVFGPETVAARDVPLVLRVDPGARVDESYVATCRRSRGIYPHGPIELEVSDPLGWFTARRRIDLIDEFKVYPRMRNVSLPDRLFSVITRGDPVRQAMRLSESDEFFSVRDYVAGDPLKRVHWALTARRDFPVVREFIPSIPDDLVIYPDVSVAVHFSGARLGNFEASVRLVASLAARAVRSSMRVQLRCGSQGTFDVDPRQGPSQTLRILEALIRVRTRRTDSYPDTLSRRLDRLPTEGTAVIVLHPYLAGDEAFSAAVRRLVARGLRVVCVVYPIRPEAATERVVGERTRMLARLSAMGVSLLDHDGMVARRGRLVAA